jgi:nitroreductase
VRDQKFNAGLEIRPPLLEKLPCTGVSCLNQLTYSEIDLPPCRFRGADYRVLYRRQKGLRLARISREAKAHMLRTSAASLASHHFQSVLENPEFDIFYHAPALIVISASAGPWIVEDCALAAENVMLAACAAGLGTCWIGFAQGWLGTPEAKSALKLSSTTVPVAPIIVGHPKTAAAPVPRKAPKIDWIS